jgi:hypothetical protein
MGQEALLPLLKIKEFGRIDTMSVPMYSVPMYSEPYTLTEESAYVDHETDSPEQVESSPFL